MGEAWYILVKRTISAFIALVLLVTAVFVVIRVMGDPVAGLAGETATPEDRERIRVRLGLDKPLSAQYVEYMGEVLRGDLGDSFGMQRPVVSLLLDRLPATLILSATTLVLSLAVAIPVGVISAIRPNSLLDSASRTFAVLGQSVPLFWFGILLIIVFSVNLQVLPSGGRDTWLHLILPSVTLAFAAMPLTMRITRSAVLEILNRDYVRTARAKGLSEGRIMSLHVLRNALIPVITVVGLRIGTLVSGQVVVEEVFAYPGIGRLAVQALRGFDFPLVQGFILFVGLSIIIINLVSDFLYAMADPRVRLQ